MDDTFGDVPIDTCRKGLTELKGIIRDHVSALGFEKGGKVYELSEVDLLAAVYRAGAGSSSSSCMWRMSRRLCGGPCVVAFGVAVINESRQSLHA